MVEIDIWATPDMLNNSNCRLAEVEHIHLIRRQGVYGLVANCPTAGTGWRVDFARRWEPSTMRAALIDTAFDPWSRFAHPAVLRVNQMPEMRRAGLIHIKANEIAVYDNPI